ncbi:MAG: zf-HC2 domain-containing protein [Planctomycetes bacterium]|nr:zf-HC2 domain-containing protein [Planctomycetota bacterium]
MKCDEIKTLLNPYVDRELSATDSDRLTKHLEECPVCAKDVVELKKVKEMLRKLPVLSVPSGLLEGVRDNLARPNNERLKTVSLFWRYRWLAASLASAAAVVLVMIMVIPSPRKVEMESPVMATIEKSKAAPETAVMAKVPPADIVTSQPIFFTQQVNISTRNVNDTLDKVYYVALLERAVKKVENEKEGKTDGAANKDSGTSAMLEAEDRDLLVKAQNQRQTMSNAAVFFRSRTQIEPSFVQRREDNKRQTVKITVPLSQKDKFLRNLKDSISDKIVLSEMQAVTPDKITAGYLADAGKSVTEDKETAREKYEYDKMARGGGEKRVEKQAGKNKDDAGESKKAQGKAEEETKTPEKDRVEKPGAPATEKPAEQPRPKPVATVGAPPATPATSMKSSGTPPPASPLAPPPPSAEGFGQAVQVQTDEIAKDSKSMKQGLSGDMRNEAGQIAQAPEEEMVEFIIVIEQVAVEAK